MTTEKYTPQIGDICYATRLSESDGETVLGRTTVIKIADINELIVSYYQFDDKRASFYNGDIKIINVEDYVFSKVNEELLKTLIRQEDSMDSRYLVKRSLYDTAIKKNDFLKQENNNLIKRKKKTNYFVMFLAAIAIMQLMLGVFLNAGKTT